MLTSGGQQFVDWSAAYRSGEAARICRLAICLLSQWSMTH
jgi:hypothetical protein